MVRSPLSLLLALVAACGAAALQAPHARAPEGPPAVLPEPVSPVRAPELADAWQDARTVFDRRCVVCHGCYDAPCQMILGSFEGIERGATKAKVYEASRLRAAEPSRLFIDATSVTEWRDRGFHGVLPEPGEDPTASLMARLLEQKRAHPLPSVGRLPPGLEIGIDREEHCPTAGEEYETYAREHPLAGMPYALPALTQDEHAALLRWLNARAPRSEAPPLPRAQAIQVERWEAFLNQPSPKAQLMARYIYEHLFLGSLYFDASERTFFRLVRSRTPPGEPIEEIATRRPFDDPKGPFHYRLRRANATVLDKTHMPYALNDARLARYTALFLTPDYDVAPEEVRDYTPEVASNPFRAFRSLPVGARYRFMLDEAEFTLMGFIKGPVCRGQVALDVIQDRFWVSFVNPDLPLVENEAAFLAQTSDRLELPAAGGSNAILVDWVKYARNHQKFLQQKAKFLAQRMKSGDDVTLDAIWDGGGDNPNAALTVFRHFDSATVTRGFVGDHPKTAWVISYSVLERIHYLLVAGFDVFGNVGHQINTRLYMDFLRMESEHNFLLLLPKARRRALVDAWYRDVRGGVKDQVYGKVARFDHETGITYRTSEPEHELYEMLRARLAKVDERRYECPVRDTPVREAFDPLIAASPRVASAFPETTFIEVRGPDGDRYFTLLRDTAYTNVAHLFREDARHRPGEDRLVLVPGFLGAYPNLLLSVTRAELPALVERAIGGGDEDGFRALCERFCVRRTSADFWPYSDRMHAAQLAAEPLRAGLFDYNRLEDR